MRDCLGASLKDPSTDAIVANMMETIGEDGWRLAEGAR